jgi:hypothetical protein
MTVEPCSNWPIFLTRRSKWTRRKKTISALWSAIKCLPATDCVRKKKKEDCSFAVYFVLAGTYADFLLSGRHDVASATMCYEACLHLNPQHGEAAHNLAMVFSPKNKRCVFF